MALIQQTSAKKPPKEGKKLLPLLVPKLCQTLISNFDELPYQKKTFDELPHGTGVVASGPSYY